MCVYVASCSIYLLYQHLFSWDVDGPSWDTHQKMMTTGHLYFGGPSTPKKNCAPQISKTQHPLVLSSTTTFHVSQAAPYFVLSTIFISPKKTEKLGPETPVHHGPISPCPGFSFLAKLCCRRFCSRITAVLRSAAWTWDNVDKSRLLNPFIIMIVVHIYIYTFIFCLFQVIIFVVLFYFTCVI